MTKVTVGQLLDLMDKNRESEEERKVLSIMRKTLEHDKRVDTKLTVNAETLADMLDCGRAAAVKVGTDAGARIRIGRRILFKVSKVNEYLQALAE